MLRVHVGRVTILSLATRANRNVTHAWPTPLQPFFNQSRSYSEDRRINAREIQDTVRSEFSREGIDPTLIFSSVTPAMVSFVTPSGMEPQ